MRLRERLRFFDLDRLVLLDCLVFDDDELVLGGFGAGGGGGAGLTTDVTEDFGAAERLEW